MVFEKSWTQLVALITIEEACNKNRHIGNAILVFQIMEVLEQRMLHAPNRSFNMVKNTK